MKEVYCYDEKTTAEGLLPFALTDYLIEEVQITSQPLIHFWQLENTFIMGMKDTRVPYLKDGLKSLADTPYKTMVRSAGGLGVINDEGILNISLFLPNENNRYSIDEAYEVMTHLMQEAFSDTGFHIEAKEIPTSYCPGKFDLSIEGKKIAGIAQRRLKNGIAVMLYLSVAGDQVFRGETVRRFYQEALKEEFGTNGYPAVDSHIMANLTDFFETSVEDVKTRFSQAFTTWQKTALNTTYLKEKMQEKEVQTFIQKKYQKMVERNADIQELLKEEEM